MSGIDDDKLLIDIYPSLQESAIFCAGGQGIQTSWSVEEIDTMLRIAILFIDPNSPISSRDNTGLRIKKSIELVVSDNPSLADAILKYEYPFPEIISEYFKFGGWYDWEELMTCRISFHNLMAHLRTPPDPSKPQDAKFRAEILTSTQQLRATIEQLEAKLFADPELRKRVREASANNLFMGFAENFAQVRE
jgi:hypothetical protein